MDYGSSYAIGGSPLGTAAGSPHAHQPVLPAPRPSKLHWSTIAFLVGMVVCGISLLATLAGVPGNVGYDVDGSANRNKPDSMDPAKIQASIDGNMKWIDNSSADAKGSYVGLLKSINRNEAAVPAMAQALLAMDAAVSAIDSGLGDLGATTGGLGDDIDILGTTSKQSGATMQALGGDIGFLSSTMVELASATEQLTKKMAAIEKQAKGIADHGTSAALRNTKTLNRALPDGVPVPMTTDGEAYDQAVKRLTTGGGGPATDGGVADVSEVPYQ